MMLVHVVAVRSTKIVALEAYKIRDLFNFLKFISGSEIRICYHMSKILLINKGVLTII